MRYGTEGLISMGKSSGIPKSWITIVATLILILYNGILGADTRWTPSIAIDASHDDNILLEGTDAEEDYIYTVQPGMVMDYMQELTRVTADARINVRRYQDNDDLDDETYHFDLKGDSKLTERFRLKGSYKFIKDTTLDSELEDTGRVFFREDRQSHDARLTPSFNLTEKTSIGISGTYRSVDYERDASVDYTVWEVGLPIWVQLETEIDTLYIRPSYSIRESDISRSKNYNFWIGWQHEATERLTFDLSTGARFTDFENLDTGESSEDWGLIGNLEFNYKFETGDVTIDFHKGLQNTVEGNEVDVSRVICRLRWLFTERVGLDLKGRYYYTSTEGTKDEDRTEYIQAGPDLFFQLTENHVAFIGYDYSVENQKDNLNAPRAERNRIWAGVKLAFPL